MKKRRGRQRELRDGANKREKDLRKEMKKEGREREKRWKGERGMAEERQGEREG